MTQDEIKNKLDDLRFEISVEMTEESIRTGYNSVHYEVLCGQMELLEGIYNLLGIEGA